MDHPSLHECKIHKFLFLIYIVDIDWNPIIQLPVDPDHVFLYGLVKEVLALCMKSVNGKKKKDLRVELDRRLAAFEYPIGWAPFSFNMLRTVNARHSMELFRKAGTICVHIFRGWYFYQWPRYNPYKRNTSNITFFCRNYTHSVAEDAPRSYATTLVDVWPRYRPRAS
jgi:hypothetical protein